MASPACALEEGSAAWLLARYKSDLILWGKVAAAPQVELHVWQRGPFRDPNIQTDLKPADIPEFIAKQLQSDLIHAIEYSAMETSSPDPPALLANYADQVDAFAQSIDRNVDGLGAPLDDHGVTLHQTRVDYLVTAEHSKAMLTV